jgi:hypothetical protein
MYKLPKKVKRIEAKVDEKVANFLWRHHPKTFALEVKIKGGTLEDHQKRALRQVANNAFKPLKLPDMGRRNPFDYIGLKGADAILCIVDGKKVTCLVNETYEINFKI